MREFLSRIGLIENFTLELFIDRSDFAKILSANVDASQLGVFDLFSKSRNAYKGTVNYDSFELMRKRKFFESRVSFVKMKGTFRQKSEKLIVETELNAFHVMMLPLIAVILLVYGFTLIAVFTGAIPDSEQGSFVPIWMIPFILLHAALMFGVPYYMLRRGMRTVKYNFERDLFFMMRDKLTQSAG